MLQLLDLARVTRILKGEANRILEKRMRFNSSLAESSVQSTSGAEVGPPRDPRWERKRRMRKETVSNAGVFVTKAPSNDRRRLVLPIARIED